MHPPSSMCLELQSPCTQESCWVERDWADITAFCQLKNDLKTIREVEVYNLWKLLQLLWLDTWTCCNSNDHWSLIMMMMMLPRMAPALKTARFTLNLFSWIYPSIFLFAEVPKNRQHNLPTFPLVDKPQHLIFNASKKWWWWWQWSLRLMMLINYDNLDEWSCQPITHCLIHVW